MLKNCSLAQKKVAVMVFGVLVVVLGIINRMFLQNIVVSAIVVTLVIVFLLVLVWFSLRSRG
jgi:hypothetical protein